MTKKEIKETKVKLAKPTYKFAVEEGDEDVTPIRRKIAKTMEVTEMFTYYDALKYVMQMKKAKEDKLAEIDGLDSMIKAYEEEIELVEKSLDVTTLENKWNVALHEKLKKEEEEKKQMENAEDLVADVLTDSK